MAFEAYLNQDKVNKPRGRKLFHTVSIGLHAVLIVVAVGGTSSITGPLLAALLLGIADVAGKYYIPKLGAFIVYTLMIALLIWRPQGLFSRLGGGK